MVGNHIADTLRYHAREAIPDELRDYVERRSAYDYHLHAEQGIEHSRYVPDQIVDRFCVIGGLDDVRRKLEQLAALGVGEINACPKKAPVAPKAAETQASSTKWSRRNLDAEPSR